jgi:hypothetical protein
MLDAPHLQFFKSAGDLADEELNGLMLRFVDDRPA